MPGTADEIRQLDLTFQLEAFKTIVRRCVSAFGRVVFLIDDMDVVRRDHFPELLQLLRPLSKIDGVCCVLAVPKYFYYGLKIKTKSDLHSTIQQCRLLGDPRFQTWLEDGGADAADDALRPLLEPMLVTLFQSRFLPRFTALSDSDAWISHLLDLWFPPGIRKPRRYAKGPKPWTLGKTLAEYQPSRREFLRETKRMLDAAAVGSDAPDCRPFGLNRNDGQADMAEMGKWRRLYFDGEEILTTELVPP